MEPTAQLPAFLSALMFGVMLAAYLQMNAVRRKSRDDRRRYQERMRRNHGGARRERQLPPGA
jgi:hypothetical protein